MSEETKLLTDFADIAKDLSAIESHLKGAAAMCGRDGTLTISTSALIEIINELHRLVKSIEAMRGKA